jgi:signal transduction histidine kinase
MARQDLTNLLSEKREDFLALTRSLAASKIVSGFFHEINQPLCGIRGFSELAQLQSEQYPNLHKYVKQIREQSDRLNDLLVEFRKIFEPTPATQDKIDVRATLEEVLEWANQQVKSRGIDLQKEITDAPLLVSLNRGDLRSLLLLLYSMVRDRVSNNPDSRPKRFLVRVQKQGAQALLEWIDTGLEQPQASEFECALCSMILQAVQGRFSIVYSPQGANVTVQIPLENK